MEDVAKKARGKISKKAEQQDDGDKEYYFDCNILEDLNSKQVVEESKQNNEDQIDLMEFINKSDFSTVNQNNEFSTFN